MPILTPNFEANGDPSSLPFALPFDRCGNRFVYTVISPRARGLSVGVNMNPDTFCNFDCCYCETNRIRRAMELKLDVNEMLIELERTLEMVHDGRIRERETYKRLPAELLQLKHVTLSGDGEPTLSPQFREAVEGVLLVRARGSAGCFKLVLVTNGSGLNLPHVRESLGLFRSTDEVWIKLDAGTQEHMSRVNKSQTPLSEIVDNIRTIGLQRPVVIQSLFPTINGEGPSESEIEAYVGVLQGLKSDGAQITNVQIYSATRPTVHSECGHLPLRDLTRIARRVREAAQVPAEVY
jgi:wyosine [tRNA(Phe)-imidazoG37] synthetase (radical SAM superfamily)